MGRATTIARLLVELYNATSHDPERFRPMDTRRLKRLLRLDGDCAETMNRGAAAYMASRDHRRMARKYGDH